MKKNYLLKANELSIGFLIKLLRIMKISVFLLFICIFQVFADDSYSQTARLTLSMNDATVEQVLVEIEAQSEFYILYNHQLVDVSRRVDIEVSNKKIKNILKAMFKDTDIEHLVMGRQIILSPKDILNEGIAKIKGPQEGIEVKGTIVDEDGNTLPGVNIVVKGTSIGTITDMDGNYTIQVGGPDAVLAFSFVGYEAQDITVGNQTTINVTLAESAIGIEEVVAIGYGTAKKVNLTGAVGMATSERLENRPIVNAGQGLQGVIPNLNIFIRNGDPTTNTDYNIRGYESITGGNPLILVDGVPMNLDNINPNDIASVNVLKDAAAAAVYGARAAFGVILVETKKGKIGKVKVQFGTELTLAHPFFLVDPITDPYEYVTTRNVPGMRDAGVPIYDETWLAGTKAWSDNPTEENAWEVVDGYLRYYGSNDYANKLITDVAPQQKYDMTISGATENASYYFSFGFLNKDGYLKPANNENFKRYNILMKVDFKINNWLSLDEKIVFNSIASDKPHFYNWDIDINSTVRTSPMSPLEFPDLPYYVNPGDHDQYEKYIGMYFGYANFFPYLLNGGRETFNLNDSWFTQGATVTPLEGLRIRADFSYNIYNRMYQDVASKVEIIATQDLLVPNLISNGFSGNDYISNTNNYNQYYVFNTYADYTMEQFANHYLKVMVGYNQEWGLNSRIYARANSLITPLLTDLNATTGTQQTAGGKSHVSLRGLFFRVNYMFKDKYLVEVNGRYDGTSRFPEESRFGFFPSVSGGWRISNEQFMESTRNVINELKIRASYGTLGNQLLGDNYYPYVSTMGSGTCPYIMTSSGLIPYVSAAGLVSPALTWETVATTNIGLDFTFLNYRLNVSADYYIRNTTGMLMSMEYPDLLGTTAPQENAADLRTKGWELAVNWSDRVGQNWKYGITLALSDNQSEITKYENPTGALSEYYVGQKLGEFWGYETVGIFQYDEDVTAAADQSKLGTNWRPGDMQYADLNGDGEISAGSLTLDDPGDRRIIGNSTGRYLFGINGNVSYKNWSLNIFFQGVGKRDYVPPNDNWCAFYPFNTGMIEKWALGESWSEDNRDAYFAAPHFSTNYKKNILPQSRFVQDASYIRLKNLTLLYNFSLKKVGLDRAQVYVSGFNLFTLSKMHKPLDPENVTTTVQEYYFERMYTLGARIAF